MPNIGLRDVPIKSHEDESLGLQQYAEALTNFAMQCETPLTIALQGDWGSGKTSLMNLIRAELEKTPETYSIVWFNTWQYSQFGMQNELPLSLIGYFLEKLNAPKEALLAVDRVKSFMRFAGSAIASIGDDLDGVAGFGAKYIGETVAKAGGADIKSGKEGRVDPGKDIAALKEQLEAAVVKVAGPTGDKRVIVFVDDLDRLAPVRAVELLESFKLFLDIPGCVYFLACDYHVVSQGLKQKFGMSKQELKGKSFFDKIIQLPFQMPVTQYRVDRYIENLLKNINVNFTTADIPQYKALLEYSIGFNPRNLKRIFNCLLLLNLVADRQDYFKDSKAAANEKHKIMFAALCLQMAYEPLYKWFVMNSNALSDGIFHAMMKESWEQKMHEQQEGGGSSETGDLKEQLAMMFKEDPSLSPGKFTAFIKAFYAAVQLAVDDDHNRLSEVELDNLRTVLTFSAVTSTTETQEVALDWNLRRENRRLADKLITTLDKKQKKFLRKAGNRGFSLYQPQKSTTAVARVRNSGPEYFGSSVELWIFQAGSTDCYGIYLSWPDVERTRQFKWRERLLESEAFKTNPELKKQIYCDFEEEDSNEYYCLLYWEFPKGLTADERYGIMLQGANACFEVLGNIEEVN